MRISINIKSAIQDLEKKIRNVPDKIKNYLTLAIKKSAFEIEAEAKKVTPVDTGRLRASIFTTLFPLIAIVQPKTNYAIFVHEGTSKMSGRPFMKEGADNAKRSIDKYFTEAIRQAIK
ncbi:MAG: hypothetical protein UV20_C0009G0020 [Candidatus Magasanikbacteria bacterium GW2011_GWA2_42_32]|uniref:HK97 gp10 family phage protein n=1 Tax=Candidatus Magasanikbacteria bacterium GW2011_GWA2_42_32 TaxID=1619039 RepID=A0A0G1CCX5_9BACT|nr:MAG: hypothetical protein UV20_C0009G0020 [Candidatus Magasanikbacteria bacterium GW2011_GWA2_42_32]HBX15905.1 hypothetical protein [Candidatus Magasanikbacteria bacterium]